MLFLPTVAFFAGIAIAQISSWPEKLVAPYIYVSEWSRYDMAKNNAASGLKYFTLAFILGDSQNNPSWSGDSLYNNFYKTYIEDVRKLGGDVIVSFGGAAGNELASVTTDENELLKKYQDVINLYGLSYIDIDIEGAPASDQSSIDRRSRVVKRLMDKNPTLKVSFTIAVTPSGLDWKGKNIIQSALNAGVQLSLVNIMAMDYGGGPKDMGATAISATLGTYQQIQEIGMKSKIGITAMIGVNDVPVEIFGLEDARKVVDWARNQDFVGLLSFWSAARDTSQNGPLCNIRKINFRCFLANQSDRI